MFQSNYIRPLIALYLVLAHNVNAQVDPHDNVLSYSNQSTWKVTTGDKMAGTAFLVDRRGYFMTAAHVVANPGSNGEPEFNKNINLSDGTSDQPVLFSARVETSLCDKLTAKNNCSLGSDLALLKIDADLNGYKPLELGMKYALADTFSAYFVGYSIDTEGPTFTGPTTFRQVDVSKITQYSNSFENKPAYFYQTSSPSFQGNSGGPILKILKSKAIVLGVMAWRKALRSTLAGNKSSPSFGTTVSTLEQIATHITADKTVVELATLVKEKRINVDSFKSRIDKLTNLQALELTKNIQSLRTDYKAYFHALYDQAVVRELDVAKPMLEGAVDIGSNIAWVREAAKTDYRKARLLAQTSDYDKAEQYLNSSIRLNKQFLAMAKSSSNTNYGVRVNQAVVADLVESNFAASNSNEAFGWMILGSELGDYRQTARLGDVSYKKKDYLAAASFYALAESQAKAQTVTTPGYLNLGYKNSLEALRLKEVSASSLPQDISKIDKLVVDQAVKKVKRENIIWEKLERDFVL